MSVVHRAGCNTSTYRFGIFRTYLLLSLHPAHFFKSPLVHRAGCNPATSRFGLFRTPSTSNCTLLTLSSFPNFQVVVFGR